MKILNGVHILLVSLWAMACLGCSESGVSEPKSKIWGEESELDGMILVHSTGATTILGTSQDGKPNEMPAMKVSFSYDFSIGQKEVSCGEFQKLMGKGFCEDKDLPVTRVTYYDAVLYANEKSKAEGMDTAYTYVDKALSPSGNCTALGGLALRPEVEAYRLPTEAEWVLVANQGWNPARGWVAGSADFRTHESCVADVNDLDVCDMAGNVMEWVNDWLGSFKDTSITNYMGAPDGGAIGERVIKGAYYGSDPENSHVYSRGDVYTVTSSNKDDYVGFRLAFGSIPDGVWMNSQGSASSSRMIPLATSAAVKKKTATFRTKLAFRNDVTGNIAFIDYSNASVSVQEIQDTINAYHPDISPDGNWVAFCTVLEGVSQKSKLYVRRLDATGSGLVQLKDSKGEPISAAIPRWRVSSKDTLLTYVSSAGNNRESSDFSATSTWLVSFSNGKFGTPKKLFDGAYHGGISEDLRLAVTGSQLLRARISKGEDDILTSAADTVWYGSEQACNASLNSDGSKRTLFLDFGGKTGQKFTGESYKTHHMLLVADSTGKLLQGVPSPSDFSFDHSEWTLGGVAPEAEKGLAVATLQAVNKSHPKIVLIDLTDSSLVELVEGEELWHPCLWAKKNASVADEVLLNADSAGVYYNDRVMYFGLELRIKMEQFWKDRENITAVSLGSSRTQFGVHAKSVKSENLVNMAFSSGDMFGMHYLAKNYVLQLLPKLKYLVLEVSPDFLWVTGDYSWYPLYENLPGYKYDENHNFWVDGVPDNFVTMVEDAPKPLSVLTLPYDPEEFLLPTKEWGVAEVAKDSVKKNDLVLDLDHYEFVETFKLFTEIVDLANEKKVKVIALVPPVNPGYKKTGAFSIYGIRRSVALDVFDRVKKMDLEFFDENKMGDHDYTSKMAYNTDHLSGAGAAQLTSRLDSLFKKLSK